VAGQYVERVSPPGRAEVFHECGAYIRHSNSLALFGHQTPDLTPSSTSSTRAVVCNREAEVVITAHGGIHIQMDTVLSNFISHGDANGRELTGTSPESPVVLAEPSGNGERLQGCQEALLEAAEVITQRPAEIGQWYQRVNRQLAGAMEYAASTSTDPPHVELSPAKLLAAQLDMSSRAAAPHGDERGVFAEQNRDAFSDLFSEFIDESALQ